MAVMAHCSDQTSKTWETRAKRAAAAAKQR
jgi:hypothetical protein